MRLADLIPFSGVVSENKDLKDELARTKTKLRATKEVFTEFTGLQKTIAFWKASSDFDCSIVSRMDVDIEEVSDCIRDVMEFYKDVAMYKYSIQLNEASKDELIQSQQNKIEELAACIYELRRNFTCANEAMK